ncbi:netrin receptor DCC-like [Glandiceps talaboti]
MKPALVIGLLIATFTTQSVECYLFTFKNNRFTRGRQSSGRYLEITKRGETEPPPSVSSVHTEVASNTITVTWTRPVDTDIAVDGYIIGYSDEGGVPDVYTIRTDSNTFTYIINNLSPSTNYIITIRAFNYAGESAAVYQVVHTESSAIISLGTQDKTQPEIIDEEQGCH